MGLEVVVCVDDPGPLTERLRQRVKDVTFVEAAGPGQLPEKIRDAEVLITTGVGLTGKLVSEAPRLRWVQALTSGVDHIIPALGSRPDVTLTSARGMHAAPVSEMAVMLMLALSRRLPRLLESQKSQSWRRDIGGLLANKTVGIAGMGAIGTALARKCAAFDMKVIGFGSQIRAVDHVSEFYQYDSLQLKAPEIDFIVNICPLTDQTRGLFDATFFAAMKSSAFFINVGRGATVDESALINALRTGMIAGAGLDAFVEEPLASSSPLWSFDNVIVTPHLAGSNNRIEEELIDFLTLNLNLALQGHYDRLTNIVGRTPD